MKRWPLPATGVRLPVIGQGTWGFGESATTRSREIEALRLGIELGMDLIDTAEIYAAGGAESVVGEAVRDCRERVFLVTKVWPSHARREDVLASVRGSLRRLRTDHVDAVLLHWPTRSVPVRETLLAFRDLLAAGLARHVGVSNFGVTGLRGVEAAGVSGAPVALNQVPYSPGNRTAESGLLPYCAAHAIVVMAYSPLGHGRWSAWRGREVLERVAAAHAATPAQVALAWLVAHPGVVAIPKAVRPEHVRDNAAAGDLGLTTEESADLGRAFAVPTGGSLRIPPLPPYDAFFRLVWWSIRRRTRPSIRRARGDV